MDGNVKDQSRSRANIVPLRVSTIVVFFVERRRYIVLVDQDEYSKKKYNIYIYLI